MRLYFLPIIAALIAIPSTGLAQISLTVEQMNELRQNYWAPFEAQVARQRYLRGTGASRLFKSRHFRVKCWEGQRLRVDEKSVLVGSAGSNTGINVILSNGRLMMIHQGAGLCVVEEQPGPSLR